MSGRRIAQFAARSGIWPDPLSILLSILLSIPLSIRERMRTLRRWPIPAIGAVLASRVVSIPPSVSHWQLMISPDFHARPRAQGAPQTSAANSQRQDASSPRWRPARSGSPAHALLAILLLLTCAAGPVGAEQAQAQAAERDAAASAAPPSERDEPSQSATPDGVSPAPQRRGYLTGYFDNDLFGGTDANYTNGVRLSWISEGEPLFNMFPARRQLEQLAGSGGDYKLIRAISGFEDESVRNGTLELNYGLSLTHLMFTPEDPQAVSQPIGQRRYAGWLALGFSVHARDHRALNSVELLLGTTGPHSRAREAQDLIHEIRDIEKFEGWDDQIPNEFTVDLSFTQKRRLRFLERRDSGFSVDGFSEWGARLGSYRTDAFVGGFFRAGFNLPADFSDPRLTATAYSHKFFDQGELANRPWSVYALFGFTGTAVGHDASLDGPLFRDFDTGNTREPLLAEVFAGFGLRWRLAEFSYVHTFRTQSYQEQGEGSDFGSLALRVQL